MAQPDDDIPTISNDGVPDLIETSGELFQFDDVPTLGEGTHDEVNTVKRLSRDRSHVRTPSRRLYVDYRSNPDAYRHLHQLPAAGESLHGVISGKYALWELVPALLERTGQSIDQLHIATLSFNKQNASDVLSLIDDGHIKTVSLLISYYFKSTSRPIYDLLIPQLRERGFPVLAMRTHCKLFLVRMTDGSRYVVESSANMRSSVNIEQFVLTRDDGLYEFHRQWIDDELMNGKELGGE
jgi:hypothetical protein